MQLGQVSTTQIPIMTVNKTYYSFDVVITLLAGNWSFFFLLWNRKVAVVAQDSIIQRFYSNVSVRGGRPKKKKKLSNVNIGGLQLHFQRKLAHMEMPFPSSDADPSLSLVEPLICSLLLCSARLGGLEFKWGSLTSFSYLQLHLGKHTQMRTHARTHTRTRHEITTGGAGGAPEDGITVLYRVSFYGNNLYFIALLAHNNAFLGNMRGLGCILYVPSRAVVLI